MNQSSGNLLQYENADNSQYQFSFKLDLQLLNLLRSFNHANHEFQDGYLESIYAQLYFYQGTPESELFSEYCVQHGNLSFSAVIFQVHYYIASLTNLSQLVKTVGGDDSKVIPISKSDINKTNILSVHSITDRQSLINHALLNEKSKTAKPEYLNLTIVITTAQAQVGNSLNIEYNVIALGIQGKGKLDPYVASHFANKLNKLYKTALYHVLLQFTENKELTTENYDERFQMIYNSVDNFSFLKDKYRLYRDKFVQLSHGDIERHLEEITKLLSDLDAEVGKSIIAREPRSNHYLEKLLIGLLGNPLQIVRDQAVICLNILYDGVDWQKRAPYKPKISKVGSKFVIQYLFEYDKSYSLNSLVILLKSYIFDSGCKQNIVSWHKPKLREYNLQTERCYMTFTMDFGKFKRCGFYDWKLVKMTGSGKLQSIQKIMDLNNDQSVGEFQEINLMETKPIQGRFIIHPKDSKQLQIHEIYVDLLDAKADQHGKFSKRGNFRKVREKIPELSGQGINCIYLMGALERDNGRVYDEENQKITFKRPEVSPLAITCRLTPNLMLGGQDEFRQMCKVAKDNKIRLIIDSVNRVSSARPHQRYKKHIVYRLDEQGRMVAIFGTDGRSLQFEDTIILNNRKKRVWDTFLEEIREFVAKYGVRGIHLDNGSSWPQIFVQNTEEMYRKESDGTQAYSNKKIFEGEVCIQNEDCGYWGSSVKESYPNPFLIKLSKNMWSKFTDFLIVAEAWGVMGEQEEREINLISSGVIPRLFKLPVQIASIFGENLKKDGTLNRTERKNVNAIKKWIEYSTKLYPKGSMIIQSTTYNSWPYPALIFKRGTWAAITLFFVLADIPMTFMGEEEGLAFREKTTNVFNYVRKQEHVEVQVHDPTQQKQHFSQRKIKRADSYIYGGDLGFGYNTYNISALQKKQSSQNLTSLTTSIQSQSAPRVQSGQSLSQMELSNIEQAQENFRKEVGPEFGFDLKQIGKHYNYLRQLRKQHKVLRNGQMVSLSAEHMYGWHTHVLSFARYSKEELALIAINFNDGGIDMFMNLKNLRYYFPNHDDSNVVVRLRNWTSPEKDDDQLDYYFIGEFLSDRLEIHLSSFRSQIWGVEIYTNDPLKQQLAEKSSLLRLKLKLSTHIPLTIYGNDKARDLILLTEKSNSLQEFLNGFAYFYETVVKPNDFDLNRLISQLKPFQTNKNKLCKLFGFFQLIINKQLTQLPFYNNIHDLILHNKLGPILFCTPELGKWTTTGGLGVMVDELTQELAKMNEEVYIITPYYHRNKKGETGYLATDGFTHLQNVDIWITGQKLTVGVFYGVYNKVHIYWLHHEQYFPSAYCGEDAVYVIKQLTTFAKATLELLCQIKLFPSLIVSNDWFCGLIPAYLNEKRYGEVFQGTKTFHIAHNLDPLYEGRLYPKPQDGTLEYIHDLPNHYFIDPYWQNLVINPSRCAFISCTNWGTVSQSYKYELLEKSPLQQLLMKHRNPFAFPNGIRREQRFKVILDKTNNDHLKAKEALQKKYFNFQQLDNNIALFGFVGRITKQKGVHLILEIVEELIQQTQGQVQIIVGGPADMREEYSAYCAQQMFRLKSMYPHNFWADPSAFFYDGTLVNVGCDFGLMPSMFEPGGIVQHEFFIGSTPVIAFKTGGLRDTVHEFDQKQLKGSGFTFEHYTRGDFLFAINRGLTIFKNPNLYQQLRKNSFDAAIDVADVGRAWAQEFYRLFEKNYIDKELIQEMMMQIKEDYVELKAQQLFKKIEGRVFKNEDKIKKNFEKILTSAKRSNLVSHSFTYRTNKIPQPRTVAISGTFDDWKERHKLKFDHFSKIWNITLKLLPGEYYYKFYVDNEWICSDDDLKDNDIYGNINNFIIIQ